MNLNLVAALVSLTLNLSAASTNAYKISKQKVDATLSTRLIFFAGTVLSFLSYWASKDKNLIAGTLNGSDVIGDVIVITSIVFFGVTRWRLKSFEKYYLLGLVLICLFWFFTADAFRSNLLTQILLSLGYFPTLHNIIKSKRNTESFAVWGLILFASVISLYPTFKAWRVNGNFLALVYSVRSIVLIGGFMSLMFIYRQVQESSLV